MICLSSSQRLTCSHAFFTESPSWPNPTQLHQSNEDGLHNNTKQLIRHKKQIRRSYLTFSSSLLLPLLQKLQKNGRKKDLLILGESSHAAL